jgi:2-methylcitrate dehydratase PrpD
MITEKLARFVVETPLDTIPAEVLDGARDALIDTIGVAIAGTLEPIAEIAVQWVADVGAKPQSTFWGQPLATSPAEAAFVNGMCAHALDFDDSLPSLRGHPSPTMVPAALAVAEAAGASGAEVLAAHALGLEVAGKIGRALGHGHYSRGWHSTATGGAFSCTAAAGRLWKLDVKQMRNAFGLAASQMSGLIRNFGTMTKPFHAGHAARVGVLSAWMAKHGFTADESIFDGKNNVIDTYGSAGVPLAEVVDKLGRPWEMTDPGIYVKRWACCYCNHRPIGGMLELIAKHGIKPDEVTAIEIGFPPGADTALVSTNPTTGLEGKFSIEYVAAATVLDGKLGLETFTDAMVQRPEARAMMAKARRYRIEDSSGVFSGVVGYNDVAIDTQRGRFEMRVDKVPGSPAAPMTREDRVEKFLDCAGRVLGEPGAKKLLALLERCRDLPDARELVRATVPAERARTASRSPATA